MFAWLAKVSLKLNGKNMKRLLRFTASWCQPCKMLAKNLENVDTTYPIEVYDIDVHDDIAGEFGIRSVPTLIRMEGNVEIDRIVGVKSTSELKTWIDS
jgi:thioredoxin 1